MVSNPTTYHPGKTHRLQRRKKKWTRKRMSPTLAAQLSYAITLNRLLDREYKAHLMDPES